MLDGETLSPLCSSALQDALAAGRTPALPEPMLISPLSALDAGEPHVPLVYPQFFAVVNRRALVPTPVNLL